MRLFSSLRRVKPQGGAEGAGGKASDIKASPQVAPGNDVMTLDDFKAEVLRHPELGDDWKAPRRLSNLFEVFDLDGNGFIDQEEFLKTASQLRAFLQALEDEVDGALEKKKKKKKTHDDVAMPAVLQSFTPLKELKEVKVALETLMPLEAALKADAASDDARKAFETGLESATAVLNKAIEARLGEPSIVPLCDAVIATGDNFFVGTYGQLWSNISETEDVEGCKDQTKRLIGCAEMGGDAHKSWLQEQGGKANALQRNRDILSLYDAALRAKDGFADVLKAIEAKVPALGSVDPGSIKGTSRILEKVLLRRDNSGCTDRVCDVVRALVKVRNMTDFGAVLRAIAELHEEKKVVVTRVKDRNTEPSPGGWRDVMINLYVASNEDHHVCEIQVAHQKMLTGREGLDGHAIYNRQRNAAELNEKQGVDGKLGRVERVTGMLREALGADELVSTWTRLEAVSDASALSEEERKAAAAVQGDAVWTLPALGALSIESIGSFESMRRLRALYKQPNMTSARSPDGLELLLNKFVGADAVESIDLSCRGRRSNKKLGPTSAAIIAIFLLDNMRLKKLNVDGHALPIDELRGTKPTEKIDLSGNELGVASAIIIASCIKENGVLKELDLDRNYLCGLDEDGDGTYIADGINALCEGLKTSSITSLRLGCNSIDVALAGGKALVAVLPQTMITTLDLDGHALQIDALRGTKPIETIDLSRKGLCDPSAFIIASCIKENGVLKELNVSWNNIGVEGGKAFAAVLKDTQITNLNIGGNRIDVEGGKAVAAVLKDTQITDLNLSVCYLSVEGGKALAAVLPQTKITSLNLFNNSIGLEGGMALADVLPQTKITTLACAAAFTLQQSVNAH